MSVSLVPPLDPPMLNKKGCMHPTLLWGGGGVGVLVQLTRRSCNTTSLVAMAITTGSANGVLVTGSDVTRSRTYVH